MLSQDPHHHPRENHRGDQRDRDRQSCLSLLMPDSSPSPVWLLLHERSHCPAELSQCAEPFEIITINDSCGFILSLGLLLHRNRELGVNKRSESRLILIHDIDINLMNILVNHLEEGQTSSKSIHTKCNPVVFIWFPSQIPVKISKQLRSRHQAFVHTQP